MALRLPPCLGADSRKGFSVTQGTASSHLPPLLLNFGARAFVSVAAQCVHAALGAHREATARRDPGLEAWEAQGTLVKGAAYVAVALVLCESAACVSCSTVF